MIFHFHYWLRGYIWRGHILFITGIIISGRAFSLAFFSFGFYLNVTVPHIEILLTLYILLFIISSLLYWWRHSYIAWFLSHFSPRYTYIHVISHCLNFMVTKQNFFKASANGNTCHSLSPPSRFYATYQKLQILIAFIFEYIFITCFLLPLRYYFFWYVLAAQKCKPTYEMILSKCDDIIIVGFLHMIYWLYYFGLLREILASTKASMFYFSFYLARYDFFSHYFHYHFDIIILFTLFTYLIWTLFILYFYKISMRPKNTLPPLRQPTVFTFKYFSNTFHLLFSISLLILLTFMQTFLNIIDVVYYIYIIDYKEAFRYFHSIIYPASALASALMRPGISNTASCHILSLIFIILIIGFHTSSYIVFLFIFLVFLFTYIIWTINFI